MCKLHIQQFMLDALPKLDAGSRVAELTPGRTLSQIRLHMCAAAPAFA